MGELHSIYTAKPVSLKEIERQHYDEILALAMAGAKTKVHLGEPKDLAQWLYEELTPQQVYALYRTRLFDVRLNARTADKEAMAYRAAAVEADAAVLTAARSLANYWAEQCEEANHVELAAEANERPYE